MAENTPGFIDPNTGTSVAPKKATPAKKGTAGATGAKAPNDPNLGVSGSPGVSEAQKQKQKADQTAATQNTKLGPGMNLVGVTIPANLISSLGLQNNLPTNLLFFPGKGLPHAPATAKELWRAIGQLTSEAQYTDTYTLANLQLLQASLKKAYFPAGFTGSGKNASKVFTAIDNNFVTNGYKLEGLTLPTNAQLYGSAAATQIKNLQSTIDQQTVALSNATAAQEASAFGVVQNYLESWGLGTNKQVVSDMYKLITRDGNHVTNTEELLNIMRGSGTSGDPKMDQQLRNAYDTAFPGLTKYNNTVNASGDPVNVHMTESAYQSYSAAVTDAATQYGAPKPTGTQIGELLNHNVSATEFQVRVRDIATAIQTSDQNVRNILETKYGVTQAGLWDYMTTGSLPSRQRQVATAQMQDYAQRVGLTGLTDQNYTQLGEMARVGAGANPLGYGVNQIQGALLTASRDTALTQAQPGQAAQTVSTQQLIGSQLAGFAGTSQPAEQVQVARAEQQKAAPFEKGGGFIETAKGVSGLGSART